MKKAFLSLALILSFMPSLAPCYDLGADGTTLIRFEERSFTAGGGKQRIIPATQFLGIDAEKMADGNLSLHLYGWGRVDLADRSNNEDATNGDLSYGYLQYRFPKSNGQLKVGRFFVYEGVAREQLDGVGARVDLLHGFTVSAFGGAPVKLDRDSKSKGDYVAGSRLGFKVPGMLEVGASFVREGGVVTGLSSDLKSERQLVGGDIWFSPHAMIELNGRTDYNTVTNGIAENSYVLTFRPSKVVTVNGLYNDNRLKDYFASSNIRSLFNPDRGEKVRSYGGEITVAVAKPLELTTGYKRTVYSGTSRDSSNRYGIEARALLLGNRFRSGFSYNRVDATSKLNTYHELRGYGLYRVAKYNASLDAIAHLYDEKIYSKSSAFEVLGSLGYQIFPLVNLSGDLSYGKNPQFDSEWKGLMRLTFNYSIASKGAAQ